MSAIQSVVGFLIVIGVLVFFHELGHFSFAKLFKMKVEEFAIGFGKRLVRVGYDGETEYTLRALPLGGFVRIKGMEIEDAVEQRITGSGSGVDDDSSELRPTATDPNDPDGFNNRPIYQRALVIAAGPAFSLVLGWLSLCLIGVIYGFPTRSTVRVDEVNKGSIAQQVGLKPGDVLIAIDGKPVNDFVNALDTIQGSAGTALRLTFRSGSAVSGATREITATPKSEVVAGLDKPIGRLGFKPSPVVLESQRVALGESFRRGNEQVAFWFQMMGKLVSSGAIKDNLGGPVAIFQETKNAAQIGGSRYLELLGQLSLSLGLFNLLPVPVLDGGHLALMALEAIRRRKLTAEQTNRVFMAGFALLVLLLIVVTFKDVTRLFMRG